MPQDTTPFIDPSVTVGGRFLNNIPSSYLNSAITGIPGVSPQQMANIARMPIDIQMQLLQQAGNLMFGTGGRNVVRNEAGGVPTPTGSYRGIPTYATNEGYITSRYDPGNRGLFMQSLDPLGLFGDKPSWKPYIQDGMYYWTNPRSQNPVPLANVPGARLKPSRTYQQTAQNVQALSDLLPYYTEAVNASKLPTAAADFNVAAATSGPYAALMTQLYNQYGPQLNAIGNEIARRNALAQATTEGQVLAGPGGDLVRQAYDLSQVYDKPFYDTRATTASRIGDLLNSIDLTGGLSPTERDEIAKGLAREGMQRGTVNAPSTSDTVANAMRYGQAGYARQQQAKSNLSQAIQSASAFLPASRSGVDVFQVATGRSSMPNTGNSLFPGLQNASTQGAQLGSQLFGGLNSLQQSNNQIEANKKDWLDKMNQITSSIKDIGSMAGGFMGMMG